MGSFLLISLMIKSSLLYFSGHFHFAILVFGSSLTCITRPCYTLTYYKFTLDLSSQANVPKTHSDACFRHRQPENNGIVGESLGLETVSQPFCPHIDGFEFLLLIFHFNTKLFFRGLFLHSPRLFLGLCNLLPCLLFLCSLVARPPNCGTTMA